MHNIKYMYRLKIIFMFNYYSWNYTELAIML